VRREEDILWSFAPHDLSMILSLVGQEPVDVTATGGYYLHKTIADVTTTHLTFPGGEQAHVFVSWLHPFKEQRLIVIGDRAMAVFDDGQPWSEKLVLYPHRIEWRETMPVPRRADANPVPLTEGEPLNLECRHFLACVASGTRPRTDGAEGLRVLRVLARASQSLTPSSAPVQGEAPSPVPSGVKIHPSAFVDEPCEIGAGTRIWHFVHILPHTRIGRDCSLGQNVMVGPDVTIGDGCKIQNNVSIYKGVTLEDGVFCGPSCVFTNVNNPRAEIERKDEFRPTLVKRGATIGANATIVCGHTIGEYAFIAAGAVVTGEVPAFALMAGVPARRIGWMSAAGERLGADLVCPRSGRRYREAGPDCIEEIA
jgi:acetyltransferase-like isoleucine patch superfamily enzyme